MSVCNFSGSLKKNRATEINTSIGANGTFAIYTGSPPASPDIAATGTKLVQLACASSAFGAVTNGVGSVAISSGGSGYAQGTYALAFSGGTGSGAVGTYTVDGSGKVVSTAITNTGSYTAAPTVSFPSGGGSGAAGGVALTGILTAGTITQANATNSGTAGYARIATSGGAGVVDLDVGTDPARFSAVINTVAIVSGGPVSCTSCVIVEG